MQAEDSTVGVDISNLPPQDWFKRFVYVSEGDYYFDVIERQEYGRAAFNAIYRGTQCHSVHNKSRRIEAATFFDENRAALGSRLLTGLTYAAGESVLVAKGNQAHANKWRDHRPQGVPGDVSMWIRHAERMLPNPVEREHVFNVLAYKRQNPKRKINHAILHAGVPGSGKDTLYAPFLYAIGGPTLANVATARAEEVAGSWGYSFESEVIVLNELRQGATPDRRALENALKPIIAAPPENLLVNKKQTHPYYVANRVFVLAFSNERAAIVIPPTDRRWFVVWSDAGMMNPEDAQTLWDWYNAGGFDHVTAWLDARDVSAFNPGATPMMTDAKLAMVDLGLSGGEAAIADMARNREGPFVRGVIGAPWSGVIAELCKGTAKPIARDMLFAAIEAAGWRDVGRITSREHSAPKHVYCAPELFEAPRSQLRNMVEAPPGLHVVK
jgi:hypothetical protein